MATQTPYMTDSDWISRLEGQIEHLATKADLERLRADVERMISEVRADMLQAVLCSDGRQHRHRQRRHRLLAPLQRGVALEAP